MKIFEAILILILSYFTRHSTRSSSVENGGTEILLTKSRIVLWALLIGITGAILFANGLVMSLIGASLWLSDPTNGVSRQLVYLGATMSLICGILSTVLLSKKRFNLQPSTQIQAKKNEKASSHKIAEIILIALLKDFVKRSKPTPTAVQKQNPPSLKPLNQAFN